MSNGTDKLKVACITVLGSGFAPLAPGTWGSLVAVIVFSPVWLTAALADASRIWVEFALVVGVALSSWLSGLWGEWAIARFGRRDPRQFTLDEFAGQWLALLAVPIGLTAGWWSFGCVVGGQFLLFRLFDILKPSPARRAERLPAGWGILADDLVAGVYANVAGQLLWRLTPLATWLGLQLSSPAGQGS